MGKGSGTQGICPIRVYEALLRDKSAVLLTAVALDKKVAATRLTHLSHRLVSPTFPKIFISKQKRSKLRDVGASKVDPLRC